MSSIPVSELTRADPGMWRAAAADVRTAARGCEAARRRAADGFEAAGRALHGLAATYDGLADAVETARRQLRRGLDYAGDHGLEVDDSGRVRSPRTLAGASEDDSLTERMQYAARLIRDALTRASTADTEAARSIRTIGALTGATDPGLVAEALRPSSPLALALRLNGRPGDVHPINVSAEQIAVVHRAAHETGMSRKLLLAILWQEQQWYQNHDPGLKGPLSSFGRIFNWTLAETIKPDKSLGITHIKLDTARKVIAAHPDRFPKEGGGNLGDLGNTELTRYIEENPNENIRLSAYHLQDLQRNGHGSDTDKQLFVLYAADTWDVREANEEHGDESGPRRHAVKDRGENWDRIEPHLEDAIAWDDLTERQQRSAIDRLAGQAPDGQHLTVDPIYETGGPAPDPDA